VILATQNGEALDWVYPETTILIENPGAVLIDAHPKATDWLEFVLGPIGQRQFALKGFRPIIDGVDTSGIVGAKDPGDPFPVPENLLTVEDDFESWSALSSKFFDEENGIIVRIIAESGKAE
jgi:sulfate transport system substrate-binding protein